MRVVNIEVLSEVWRENEWVLCDVKEVIRQLIKSMSEIPSNTTIRFVFSHVEEGSFVLQSFIHVGQVLTEEEELHDTIVEWVDKSKVLFNFFARNYFNKFEFVELFWLHI
jgi:hypothetical protein